jgi:hypothetical protein
MWVGVVRSGNKFGRSCERPPPGGVWGAGFGDGYLDSGDGTDDFYVRALRAGSCN